jgi:hypothetical protein
VSVTYINLLSQPHLLKESTHFYVRCKPYKVDGTIMKINLIYTCEKMLVFQSHFICVSNVKFSHLATRPFHLSDIECRAHIKYHFYCLNLLLLPLQPESLHDYEYGNGIVLPDTLNAINQFYV